MENNELAERVMTSYRTSWFEAINEALVLKAQVGILNEKYVEQGNKVQQLEQQIEQYKKQIEALKLQRAQPNKPEQK